MTELDRRWLNGQMTGENVWVEKLRPVHFNAHFHLCCIMLYLEISQIHLNSQQSIMSAPKNTLSMSKTKWRQLESFSQKSNKITNAQQLVSFCKVYSSLQSMISIKEIKLWSKTCQKICKIMPPALFFSCLCQVALLRLPSLILRITSYCAKNDFDARKGRKKSFLLACHIAMFWLRLKK